MGATGQQTLCGEALPKHWLSQPTQELCNGTGDPMQAHEILTYTGEVWPQGLWGFLVAHLQPCWGSTAVEGELPSGPPEP